MSEEVCDDYIETYTGGRFYFGERMPESDIRIEDIAQALSVEQRFGGHAKEQYTVAEHCCHVYDLYITKGTVSWPGPLAALLHDAHEAYTKDVMKPLRRAPGMEGYNKICKRAQEVIERKFQMEMILSTQQELIKRCDLTMLRTEASELMHSRGEGWLWPDGLLDTSRAIQKWEAARAREEFLSRFIRCF